MPYNDITKADAYFLAHFGYDQWEPLTDVIKDQLLVSASQYLDNLCSWYGQPAVAGQDGAFPRKGMSGIPEEILTAELEIAYQINAMGGLANSQSSGQELLELKAGSAMLKFSDTGSGSSSNSSPVNEIVRSILSKYGSCNFSTGCSQIPMELG